MANLDLTYGPDECTQAFENHTNGYLVSLAGPGTGKTFSLLKRTEALIARGISQDTVCYLTFIKEISNAFIQDYIEKFGQASYDATKPRISTLHSFACRLLRNQGYRLGYDGELFFANTAESDNDAAETLLIDLLPFVNGVQCRTPAQLRAHLKTIKAAWRDTVDPSSFADPIPLILTHAENLFRAFRVVDWDQTIPLSHRLAVGMGALPDWITDIRHYYVDEYQDFNRAEQALILFLLPRATSAVIVGDDDQSLYSGRGGSPDGIRNLFNNPTHDQVSLVNCYRCSEAIVRSANTFQRSMHHNPRLMQSTKGNGQILTYRFKSSKAEIAFLAAFLQECIVHMPAEPTPKDGTVCLFPSWKVLESYFQSLSPLVACVKRQSTPHSRRLWLERILHLTCSPNKRFLERLILNEYGQIKPRHKRLLVQRIVQRDVSVSIALRSLISDGELTGAAQVAASEFCQLIEDINSQDAVRIAPHIAAQLALDPAAVEAQLNSILARLADPKQEDIIAESCDNLLPDSVAPVEDPRSILFLTMHGSKGLTKKNVVIPGLEAAWLPGVSQGPDLQERRRLFYVAMTRATDCVLMTVPNNRGRNDSLNFNTPGRSEPSPFIADAGLRCTYHE
jgi:DNA helicase II / ATP-dependent DNA helicase PcrA